MGDRESTLRVSAQVEERASEGGRWQSVDDREVVPRQPPRLDERAAGDPMAPASWYDDLHSVVAGVVVAAV
jgi:hypothetical protein